MLNDEFMSTLRRDIQVNETRFDMLSVVVFRFNQFAPRILAPLAAFADIVWLRMIVGAELPKSVACGAGLRLPHGGRGVIISQNATIGCDATIYHGVTIGVSGEARNVPVLGDRVYVGSKATIIGRVTVGDDARVGAGAVVIHDIPARSTAVGVPARTRTLTN